MWQYHSQSGIPRYKSYMMFSLLLSENSSITSQGTVFHTCLLKESLDNEMIDPFLLQAWSTFGIETSLLQWPLIYSIFLYSTVLISHKYSYDRDRQRMLERQGLKLLKGPFGENIENSRPPSSHFRDLIPHWTKHEKVNTGDVAYSMDFYTERAILST